MIVSSANGTNVTSRKIRLPVRGSRAAIAVIVPDHSSVNTSGCHAQSDTLLIAP